MLHLCQPVVQGPGSGDGETGSGGRQQLEDSHMPWLPGAAFILLMTSDLQERE